MSSSLRAQQQQSLVSLLNFNDPSPSNALSTWKVLVLDSRAQDVLATTLRVADLRDNGVTLHMQVATTLCLGLGLTGLQAAALGQAFNPRCARNLPRLAHL